MKYKFNGQVAYSVDSLKDYRDIVLTDMGNGDCDRNTVKYNILSTCFSAMNDRWSSCLGLTLREGETFTFEISNETGLSLECTNKDMVTHKGKFLGFSDSFAEDFEDLLDDILGVYTAGEFIGMSVRFQ